MEQKQKTKPARQQKRDRSHLVFMMIAAVVLLYIGRSFFGIFSAAPETTPAMPVERSSTLTRRPTTWKSVRTVNIQSSSTRNTRASTCGSRLSEVGSTHKSAKHHS